MSDALAQLHIEKDRFGRYYIAYPDGSCFQGYYKTKRGATIMLARLKKGMK